VIQVSNVNITSCGGDPEIGWYNRVPEYVISAFMGDKLVEGYTRNTAELLHRPLQGHHPVGCFTRKHSLHNRTRLTCRRITEIAILR